MQSNAMIGIISYLPMDLNIRKTRLQTHLKQLHNICSTFPDCSVLCMYQQYEPAEIKQCKQASATSVSFEYESCEKLGANGARNRILKEFYASDCDFLMLMDDDTTLYPYYDVQNILNDLCAFKRKNELGMIRPVVPFMTPFKQANYEQRNVIENYWILRSSMGLIPFSMIILSNLNKNFNEAVFFDEEMNPQKGEGYDDYDFVWRLRERRIPSHRCQQIIVNPLYSDSVIYSNTGRKQSHINNVTHVYDKYRHLGIQYTVANGKIKSNVAKLNIYQTEYVPRLHTYTFEQNMIPKNVPGAVSCNLKRKSLID